MTVIKRGRRVTADENKAAMDRLRTLPADVMEDVERYRAYYELAAYEMGVINAQMTLNGTSAEMFTTTPFCPFVGEPWEVVDD